MLNIIDIPVSKSITRGKKYPRSVRQLSAWFGRTHGYTNDVSTDEESVLQKRNL